MTTRQYLMRISAALSKADQCDKAMDNAVGAARAVMQRGIRQGFRLLKNSFHFKPPAISLIFASTCSGEGIMPPVRLQR